MMVVRVSAARVNRNPHLAKAAHAADLFRA
jgi:hypothetical protein